MKTLLKGLILSVVFLNSVSFGKGLIEVKDLKSHLGKDDTIILDIRSKISKESIKDFKEGHIPGAVYSDYLEESWRIKIGDKPAMLPPDNVLTQLLQRLGIDESKTVIVVSGGQDSSDFGSAARVYWTLQAVGIPNVFVLNGGYRAWKSENAKDAAGYPIEKGDARSVFPSEFEAKINPKLLITTPDVKKNLNNPKYLFVDSRPESFFVGLEKHESSKSAGTLAGAKNVQHVNFYDAKTGRFANKADVQNILQKNGITSDKTIVPFCNTGHWAAVAWFGISEVGGVPATLYPRLHGGMDKRPRQPCSARIIF
ncbi:hypothetical protein CHS0354_006833 [Potamilus streckersoni]|uniref:Rhodanese domain-containing protein n=1 Tax=Potamilus streckersoni TaxID=2493646 RepID=A0AAE0WCS0_9BIVA|nr:hypothetical protein CHS0354_006833 [Potamilus streckersoni]